MHGTWALVPLPPHCKPIGCKWVFRVSKKTDGSKNKYARLVAEGFHQKSGLNFNETFSPVVMTRFIWVSLLVWSLWKSLVYCLIWALYGLKKAPMAWWYRLKDALLKLGCSSPSKCDTLLFIYSHHGTHIYVLIYVDNILIRGTSPNLIQDLIRKLN